MKKITALAVVSAMTLSACAEKSSDIAAAYVSPMQYSNYNCSQIASEAQRVSSRAAQAMGQQDKKADNDEAMMAIGMILFWPALFALNGDSESAGEVARLKGEMEALEQASIQKDCGIEFQRAASASA